MLKTSNKVVVMENQFKAKVMHSEGASIDDICDTLGISLALAEEYVDMPTDLSVLDDLGVIQLPIDNQFDDVSVVETKNQILRYSAFLAKETMLNLNKPNACNAIGKASVILGNLTAIIDKTGKVEGEEEANGLREFLRD